MELYAKLNALRLTFNAILIVFLLAGCSGSVPPIEVSVDAKSAMIAEVKNGEILFEKAPDTRYPPASTAKVMTAIVAIENMPLDEVIVPTTRTLRVEPTVAGLKAGTGYRLKDLLSAILIKSANDAAVVIAVAVAGSEKEFAALMNAKARDIGMADTYFANASGLPTGREDRQYTTARDLAKMMRYATRYRTILEAMSKKEAEIFGSDGRRIYLKTHNKTLLWSSEAPWGKTGYTRQAKRTFAGIDPSLRPRIVFSLLKSNDLWDDITELKDRGLEIYDERHRTFFSDLFDWIKRQRDRGREEVSEVYDLVYE